MTARTANIVTVFWIIIAASSLGMLFVSCKNHNLAMQERMEAQRILEHSQKLLKDAEKKAAMQN